MTEEIKKLIETAPVKRSGVFQSFLMIPSGEKYDGFWGENGYNNIILLGMSEEGWCNITECADSISFAQTSSINFDVPNDLNCVRFWFNEPIKIRNELNLSTVIGYPSDALTMIEKYIKENKDGEIH